MGLTLFYMQDYAFRRVVQGTLKCVLPRGRAAPSSLLHADLTRTSNSGPSLLICIPTTMRV